MEGSIYGQDLAHNYFFFFCIKQLEKYMSYKTYQTIAVSTRQKQFRTIVPKIKKTNVMSPKIASSLFTRRPFVYKE